MNNAKSICNSCGSEVKGDFHTFCEEGCPTCGSHNTVIETLTKLKISASELKELKDKFDWCMENEAECQNTKYKEDSYRDNWFVLRNFLEEIFKNSDQN